jgi:hypothetical protein
MFFVNQHGVFRLGGFDPFASVFQAAGVFSDGDDFEIFAFQFCVKFLPTWQVKPAASPRSPGDQQDFLATKFLQRTHLAG